MYVRKFLIRWFMIGWNPPGPLRAPIKVNGGEVTSKKKRNGVPVLGDAIELSHSMRWRPKIDRLLGDINGLKTNEERAKWVHKGTKKIMHLGGNLEVTETHIINLVTNCFKKTCSYMGQNCLKNGTKDAHPIPPSLLF